MEDLLQGEEQDGFRPEDDRERERMSEREKREEREREGAQVQIERRTAKNVPADSGLHRPLAS